MTYKCDECEEPLGIPIFAETKFAYARVSNPSLSQNPPDYNHPGHVLVLPKRHVEERTHLTLSEMAGLNELTNRIAKVIKQKFSYQSLIIMEVDGERSIKHLHTHIIPADKPYAIKMKPKEIDSKQVADLTKLLKQALDLPSL